MKFQDIPKFTRDGAWACNYWIGRITTTIRDFEKEYGLQLIPDFQRGHVWSEQQQIAFVEFFLKGGKLNPIYLNCPDWNGFNDGFYHDMVCVDGLQRLTALMRFENNEIKAFGLYLNEFDDKPSMTNTIVININNLKTKKDVLQWYVDLNSGGTVHSDEEILRVKKMIKDSK